MKFHLAVAVLLLIPAFLFAQEFRGAIGGAVTDPSGAMIAGARITVLEINTGTKVEIRADGSGHYTAPFLLPGDYQVTVAFEGFKEFVRKGIHLGAGEKTVVDARLEVGDASVAVEVTAEAPQLNSENASVGQAITTKEVEDLPNNGRTPMMLATLSMGVIATAQPSQVLPFASGGGASISISGSPNQTNELLIDGSPNTTWDGRLAYSPPQDAVQEVRVKAFDTDAGYGRTAAGTVNVVLKSGTNQLHGSANWNNQPTNLVANSFFSNKSGVPVVATHFNQYGGTAGGPLYLPKVLDGRNRLFWFFSFDGVQDTTPSTVYVTVPTDAERTGDFSKLLNLASPTIIYNPYSAVQSGARINRTPYPSNRIPASQLNPIALQLQQFYPEPNITQPGRSDDFGNFGSNAPSKDGYTNEFGRFDYNINSNNRSYFNIRHTDYFQTKNGYFSNDATGSNLSRSNWGLSADHVLMANATNVVDIRANFSRMYEDHASPSFGFDPTSIGLPSYITASSQYLQLPYVRFNNGSPSSSGAPGGFQDLGGSGANKLPSQSAQLYGSWVMLKGAHTVKVGADARQYRFNNLSYGSATGQYSFNGNSWVRAADNSSSTVALGQDYASFLLGLPYTGGSSVFDVNASGMYYSYYVAGYVQDDWRVKSNLTLNVGLRFDHDFPYHERWARTVNGFAFNTPSPLQAAAQAAYARNSSPLLAPGDFHVLGGYTFASAGDTAIFSNNSHLFSPRFGFAWTPPRMNGKTVVRGGFGMFVSQTTVSTLQITGAYSTNPILTQDGFSQSTPLTATNDNYLTPAATFSNPFPNGILAPTGSSAGLLTYAGQTAHFLNPSVSSPYSVRWNFGIQHAITPNVTLELVYMGNHAVHLPVTYTQLNVVPRQYLSTLGVRDQSVISPLTATVPNPFYGLQTSAGTNTTTSTAQILARYPQFPVGSGSGSTGVLEQNLNAGSSYFESLNIRITKRFSRGLTLTANFIKSRMTDQTTWLNDTDPRPEKRISPFDHPYRFVTAFSYELPVGSGRPVNLRSRWSNAILGGWKITNIYTYQTGAPLAWVNGSTSTPGDYVYFGAPLDLNNRAINGPAFNVAAFDTRSANQFQYHIRTFSTTFGTLRQDGINDWNASLLKQFHFGEKRYVQLRFESFNVINHPTFTAPNLQANNSQFGVITSQLNRPRLLQVAIRIVF